MMADIDAAAPRMEVRRKQPAAIWSVIALSGAMLAEAGLLAWAASGNSNLVIATIFHVAIIVGLWFGLRETIMSGADGGLALLGLIATAAAGPFGAAAALLIPLLSGPATANPRRLEAWYRRIALSAELDEFTRLSDRIAVGRTADPAVRAPAAFEAVMRSGAIGQQQIILGIVARSFHPDFLPVLQLALRSKEPVVRVQAAAVAARIRPQLETIAQSLFDRAADPTPSPATAQALVSDLDRITASPLVDDRVREKAARVRDGVRTRSAAQAAASQNASSVTYGAKGLELERLLADGNFSAFRAARLAERRPMQGRFRRHRVCARPVSKALSLRPLEMRR
jgi:hypothetical protein